MNYNYLKTLPKDILIKIITEVESNCLNERRQWFVDTVKNNNLNICDNCYLILQERTNHYFKWCEGCDFICCRECLDKNNIKFHPCGECGIKICPKCTYCDECK